MPNARTPSKVVAAYRKAAMKILHLTKEEAAEAVYTPANDRGQWSPGSRGIVNFETGHIASYWDANFLDVLVALDRAAGLGTYIEPINAAVGAIWEG